MYARACALSLLLMTACKDKPKESAATVTAEGPTQPVASDAAAFDACKLLTKDEAARLLGAPALDPKTEAAPVSFLCTYRNQDDYYSGVGVTYFPQADDAFHTYRGLHTDSVDVPGVGTRAFRSQKGIGMGVEMNGHFAVISLSRSQGAAPPSAEIVEQQLKALASRM